MSRTPMNRCPVVHLHSVSGEVGGLLPVRNLFKVTERHGLCGMLGAHNIDKLGDPQIFRLHLALKPSSHLAH